MDEDALLGGSDDEYSARPSRLRTWKAETKNKTRTTSYWSSASAAMKTEGNMLTEGSKEILDDVSGPDADISSQDLRLSFDTFNLF